jgi:PleD family two-component response regulator
MAIAALQILHETSEVSHVIILSPEFASLVPNWEQNTKTLISPANQALYASKSQGHNRVVYLD